MATTNNSGGKAPPIQLPRQTFASAVQVSDVGYRKDKDATIVDNEQRYFNTTIQDIRSLAPTQAIRILTRIDGTFSAALNGYLQLAMSSGYTVTGYMAGTHEFDPASTLAARSVLASMDTQYDYTIGFSLKPSMDSLLETMLKEVLQTGACMGELVLNKFKLPEQIVPINITSLEWHSRADGTRYPMQIPVSGPKLSLDFPTIFYASHAQQTNTIFPRSPFESALNMLYQYQGLLEDIFRVIRRTGHTRMVVKVTQEAIMKMAPPDVAQDPVKLTKFFNDTRVEIETVLSNLKPEDAIVMYDSAEVDSISAAGDKADYSALLDTLSGMLASSLKTMPSILGMRIGGSQSLSNTESLVMLKMVEGIRRPVETVISRALTLAVRLAAGTDSYIKFAFNSVELRPDAELSAHRSVQQQNIQRQLSLGYLSDDEAAHLMGAFPRAPGAPNLSGTMFMDPAGNNAQPKTMTTAQDGAQQKTLNEGNENGPATSNGGGNPNG